MNSLKRKIHTTRIILAVAILSVVATAAYLFVRSLNTPTALETEFAEMNRRQLADPGTASRLYNVNLVSASIPGTASQATYRFEDLSDPVIVRLSLPFPEPDGKEFSAFLERNGESAFTALEARVFRNPMGPELRFLLPKEVLTPARYRVTFPNERPEYQNTSFQFTVE